MTLTSLVFIAPDRIRVTYGSMTSPFTGLSTAGFTLTVLAATLPLSRVERTGDFTFDLITSAPVYAGSSPTLAYDAGVGSLGDSAPSLATTFSATAVTDTGLPALALLTPGSEKNVTGPAATVTNGVELWVTPTAPAYFARTNAHPLGPVTLTAFAPRASATLAIASSADNGIVNAYAGQNVRSESGASANSVSVPFGPHAKFTIESATNPFFRLTATGGPVLVTVSAGTPITRLPSSGVL